MTASVEFLFIASNLALDFVNTEVMVDQQPHDRLQSDDDVRRWLAEAEALPEANDELASSAATGTLLALARELRAELKLHLRLSRQQLGQQPAATLTVVNRVLARGAPIQSLQWQADSQQHRLLTRPSSDSDEALLYPVAEAFAQLMTTAKPELIKQCEASDCILWFHDQTKSHRRRWCSMALCGNRMKAAAHRQRAKRG